MNKKIALLPLDFRPYTRELPKQIASIAGWEVLVPEKKHLSFLKKPGNITALKDWLIEVSSEVDGFVISIDTLSYGGLIPSRVNTEDIEVIKSRVSLLQQLQNKKVMAFSTTMRISNSYVNEQEKEYWSDFGKEIWEYSYHLHRYEETENVESLEKIKQLEELIPKTILEDYLETRQRNFQINLHLLDYVENGLIDLLIVPQDDTAIYGLNIQEQKRLRSEVSQRLLQDKVLIYPGADEVANTLVARMILELEGSFQPAFYPFYSGETGALVPAMYEDRAITESVKAQIYAIGGLTVDTSVEADITLAVNVPGKKQGDLALEIDLNEVDTGDRNIGEWLARIQYYLSKDRRVAVADLAYANGSDKEMVSQLQRKKLYHRLSGFAGWNTAGNTLGTVIPMAAMAYVAELTKNLPPNEAKRRLLHQLIVRNLSDYIYLSITRNEVKRRVGNQPVSFKELLSLTESVFNENIEKEWKRYYPYDFAGYVWNVDRINLPWKRLFEIEVDIELHKKQ